MCSDLMTGRQRAKNQKAGCQARPPKPFLRLVIIFLFLLVAIELESKVRSVNCYSFARHLVRAFTHCTADLRG